MNICKVLIKQISIQNWKILEKTMPNINNMGNLILYGPSGSGKYSQSLRLIKKYSPSELKYDKRITLNSRQIQIYLSN